MESSLRSVFRGAEGGYRTLYSDLDGQGNPRRRVESWVGKPETVNVYTYVYDRRGNWVRRVEHAVESRFGTEERVPQELAVRTLEYYP